MLTFARTGGGTRTLPVNLTSADPLVIRIAARELAEPAELLTLERLADGSANLRKDGTTIGVLTPRKGP